MAKKIVISGHIGFDVTPSDIRSQLQEAKGQDIEVDVNTPGGFVFQGIEIFNLLREHPEHVTMRLQSLAASMGSYILLAGDKIVAFDNAVFMIHNALSIVMGNHNEMRKMANYLEGVSNLLAKMYAQKSGKPHDEIKQLMNDETFLYGNEILDAGFVDEIIESPPEDKDKHNKDSAITQARLSVENCMAMIKDSEQAKQDLQQAAAYIVVDNSYYENTGLSYKNFAWLGDEIYDNAESFNPEAPFPNEHACRIRKPGDFQKDSFRRIKSGGEGKKFDIIIGRLKGKTTTTTQAFRYPKSTWSESEARKHCKDHDGILFEPASGIANKHSGCPECNKKTEVRQMSKTLRELFEENPAAKIEHDKVVADAKIEGVTSGSKSIQDINTKVAPIIASDVYPKAIRELAGKVIKGESNYSALEAVVTMFDAQTEEKKAAAAKKENGKETPGEQGQQGGREDGSIENADDYNAELAKEKGESDKK